MVGVSLKCQYGLRAMFELARRYSEGKVVGIGELAAAQYIPQRFLENIMNVLRQGGFVESRRGRNGGFCLARKPESITLGALVKFIDGGIYNIECENSHLSKQCPMKGGCIFLSVWQEAKSALEAVYYGKNLQDLVDAEKSMYPPDYII